MDMELSVHTKASNPSVVVTSRKKEDMEGHKDNECMKHEGEVAKLEGKITSALSCYHLLNMQFSLVVIFAKQNWRTL